MLTSTPNSIASRRGAARVGAPTIVMFVLFLVSLFYAWVAQDAEAAMKMELDAAVNARAESQASVETITRDLADRSILLGFSENPATIPSNVESGAASLAEMKANFPNMEPVKTFEGAVPIAISSYQTKVAQIGALQTRIGELEGQVSAERDAKAALQSEKDQRISTLEQEARDASETADSEISRLEDSVSKLRSQLNSTTEQVTDAEDAKRATERALENAKLEHAAQRGNWTSLRNDMKRRGEKADGEITRAPSSGSSAAVLAPTPPRPRPSAASPASAPSSPRSPSTTSPIASSRSSSETRSTTRSTRPRDSAARSSPATSRARTTRPSSARSSRRSGSTSRATSRTPRTS